MPGSPVRPGRFSVFSFAAVISLMSRPFRVVTTTMPHLWAERTLLNLAGPDSAGQYSPRYTARYWRFR